MLLLSRCSARIGPFGSSFFSDRSARRRGLSPHVGCE